MKYLFSAFFLLLCISLVQAQSQSNVSVNVQKKNDERHVKITKETDGKSKVIEWTDMGEIPSDIKEQLIKEGIDVQLLDGGDENIVVKKKEVNVKSDGKNKVIKIKKIGDGDNIQEIEWDGEGEMPKEMKEMMNEYEIEMEDEVGEQRRVIMIKKDREDGKATVVKEMKKGKGVNKKEGGSYMFFKNDGDHEDVMEWTEDGEHEIVVKRGGKKGLHEGHGNMFFMADDDNDFPMSAAYVGAQIGNNDKGVEILDLIKDGPADNAKLLKGDVVTKVNGARTKNVDGFMRLLNYFEPKDQVELKILRGGKEMSIKLSFGERPSHAK